MDIFVTRLPILLFLTVKKEEVLNKKCEWIRVLTKASLCINQGARADLISIGESYFLTEQQNK
mgnify:CR=1 FL=1